MFSNHCSYNHTKSANKILHLNFNLSLWETRKFSQSKAIENGLLVLWNEAHWRLPVILVKTNKNTLTFSQLLTAQQLRHIFSVIWSTSIFSLKIYGNRHFLYWRTCSNIYACTVIQCKALRLICKIDHTLRQLIVACVKSFIPLHYVLARLIQISALHINKYRLKMKGT